MAGAPSLRVEAGQEMRVVLVDVIPHLLVQLLLNTIPRHREQAQLAYKVAFGALQGYLK